MTRIQDEVTVYVGKIFVLPFAVDLPACNADTLLLLDHRGSEALRPQFKRTQRG